MICHRAKAMVVLLFCVKIGQADVEGCFDHFLGRISSAHPSQDLTPRLPKPLGSHESTTFTLTILYLGSELNSGNHQITRLL